MLRRTLQLLPLTLVSLAVLAAPGSEAAVVVIDDFNQDQGPTTSVASNTGFPSLSVLFETRTIGITPPDGSGSIEVDLGNLVVTNIDGDPNLQGGVLWPYLPLGTGTKDLIDGTNDRFRLEMGEVQGTWTAQIGVTYQNTTSFSSEVALSESLAANYFFLFQDFAGIDFSEVTQVQLLLENTSAAGNFAMSQQLVAMPEPGTACLLALGLIGLALQGQRRQIA